LEKQNDKAAYLPMFFYVKIINSFS